MTRDTVTARVLRKDLHPRGGISHRVTEGVSRILFLLFACVSILSVLTIVMFLLVQGVPALSEIGVTEFLFGSEWRPSADIYGVLTMVVGSLSVTAGAIIAGVPLALLTAIFLARFCPAPFYRVLKPVLRLMAGIPSVVYGFFGLTVIVPILYNVFGSGKGILSASVLLGMMILPTVAEVSENALRAVPGSYYEGALALGATPEAGVFSVVLPAARPGVSAAIVLGIGRAIGEATAVVMVAGNQPVLPDGLLSGVRTLTANIVLEMSYAADLHLGALIATGIVLFVFVLLTNVALAALRHTGRQK